MSTKSVIKSMGDLGKDETNYLTRLQLAISQRPSSPDSVQLAKDLELATDHRRASQLTSPEFFLQLKRIECKLQCSSGMSRETFLVFVDGEMSVSQASKETLGHVAKLIGARDHNLSPSVMGEICDCCLMAWRP